MNDLFALPPADLNAELGHDLALLPTGWPEAGLKPHPFAAINRMMTADEFAELKASVRERGLLEKIVIFEDKILDGRNRFLAGIAVGRFVSTVEWRTHPDFVEFGGKGWDGDRGTEPLNFVWDMEVRRHRSARDTALAAARYLRLIAEFKPANETEKTAKLRLPTQAEIAKRHGISERLVHSALMLLDRAEPEVVKAVEEGRLSLTDGAEVISRLDAEEQRLFTRVIEENPDRKATKAAVKKATKPKARPAADLPSPMSRGDLANFAELMVNEARRAAKAHGGRGASISADFVLNNARALMIIEPGDEYALTRSMLLAVGKLRDNMPAAAAKPKKDDPGSGPTTLPMGGEWSLKIGGLKPKHSASIAVFHEEDETFSIAVSYDFGSRSAAGPFSGSHASFREAIAAAAGQLRAAMDDLAGATDSVTSDNTKASAYDGVTWLDKRLAEWGIALPAESPFAAPGEASNADRPELAAYLAALEVAADLKGKHTRETARPVLEAGVAADIKRQQIADDIGHPLGTVSGWCNKLGLQDHSRLKDTAANATAAAQKARRGEATA